MSKAILLSIKPKWVAKILNGEKTIEVRKQFPEDYVGWVYIYCSKGNKKDWHLIEVVDTDTGWEGYEYDYYIGSKGYLDWCLEGKVVARFWCDKVEKIKYHFGYYDMGDWTESYIKEKSCLTSEELDDYLKASEEYNEKIPSRVYGRAVPISKLEIFDKPKELSEFMLYCETHRKKLASWTNHKCNKCPYLIDGAGCCPKLTKAPQNYCYVEELKQ